jgi:hypothetical protein
MTRMLPATFPEATTSSEAEMFRLIRDAPGSDEFVCFHSLGIARHRRKDYAEADFVVLAPAGLFCIEVKGGEVHRHDGLWQIGWPGKSYVSVEGPFKQAQGARWALIDYLSDRLGRNMRNHAIVGWGVAFPDIQFDRQDPEWDLEVVFDQRDKCRSFAAYIERLARYFQSRGAETGRAVAPALKPSDRAEIVDALRGNFHVVPSLRGLLLESERELVALSEDQHRVLDLALNDSNPRLICEGGPGTGKSLIAVEAARRLARSGKKVLLLCFNDNLGEHLRLDLAETDPRIRVSTVHSFLGETINRGGFGEELRSARRDGTDHHLFDEAYPRLFETACAALLEESELPQYDVLIVDETQDVLNGPIMSCLDLILNGGFAAGRWLIFHDPGLQSAIYNRADSRVLDRLKSFGAACFQLSENFRNPKAVVTEACVTTQTAVPVCRRSLVSPVDYRIVLNERDQAKKLRALLLELMREGISPEQVTILSPKRARESCAITFPPDVGKPMHVLDGQSGRRPAGAFSVASIAGFKGLENDVIILTDLPPEFISERTRADLYVGMTRARTKLFAMVPQSFLDARTSI